MKPPTLFVEYLRNLDLHSETNSNNKVSFAYNIYLPLMRLKYGYCKYQDIRVAFYPNKYEQEDTDKIMRFSLKSPMFLDGSDLQRMQCA